MDGNMMMKLRVRVAAAIFPMTVLVRMAAYRRGEQMATKRSKAMASRTAESATKRKCMKNIWVRQPSKEMWLEPSQKLASALGIVAVESKTSAPANMDRNMYMGSCRPGWDRMTQIKRPLPARAATYMVQKGMESQMCRCSSPGMPVRRQPAMRVSELFVAAVPLAEKRVMIFCRTFTYAIGEK